MQLRLMPGTCRYVPAPQPQSVSLPLNDSTIHAKTPSGVCRQMRQNPAPGAADPRIAPAHWGSGSPCAWSGVVRVGPCPHARVRRAASASAAARGGC